MLSLECWSKSRWNRLAVGSLIEDRYAIDRVLSRRVVAVTLMICLCVAREAI